MNERVFQDCTSLTRVNIPVGVDTIGQFAFANCTALEAVQLPKCLRLISQGAFSGCKSLMYVSDDYIYNGKITIEMEAFVNCTSLKDIRLSNCEKVESWAFQNGTSLESITVGWYWFPQTIEIKPNAFEGCANFHSMTLDTGLHNLTIPKTVDVKDIYFLGDDENWKRVEKEIHIANMKECVVHRLEGCFKNGKRLNAQNTKITHF